MITSRVDLILKRYCYYLQLTVALSHLWPTQLCTLLLHPNLFKASLFTPSQEVLISFQLFFMTSFHPRRGRPTFRLVLDGWPERTIFGNLSSLFRRTCPSHLNLSLIVALESGIESYFSYSLLFKIRSVSRVSTTMCKQFLWKTSSIFPSAFRSAHASEPYLTTVITVPSNILIFV